MNKNVGSAKNAGFTLIELLIVIAIISILSAILMVNFVGIRQRARDAQRKSDLRQIQSALELFRADHGCYPYTGCIIAFPTCGSALAYNGFTYMQKIPCDPAGSSYIYNNTNGNTYSLTACLENQSDGQKDASTSSSCTSTNVSFTLLNP